MDELKDVAVAYYNGRLEEEKMIAKQFFKSMDLNSDGKISLDEYRKMVDPCFSGKHIFKELDNNGDGTLDFDEFLTLFYMVQVAIPKCNGCHDLLIGSYFSCMPCRGKSSYDLCCNCYSVGKFKHDHPSTEFIDTRAMLKLLDQLIQEKRNKANCETNVEDKDADESSNTTETQSPPTMNRADTFFRSASVLFGVGNSVHAGLVLGGVVSAASCSIL